MTENLLMDEISRVPEQIRGCFWDMENRIRQFLSVEEIYDIQNIYITGCGDSHMAALCASMAFLRLTGCHVFTPTALTQSFYTFPKGPAKNNLVIGLSNSGETSRTVEALIRMGRLGCKTAALTCKRESRLSEAADKTFYLEIPQWTNQPVPGVRGIVIPLLALYLLSIRIGEVKGIISMDEAGKLRRELYSMADRIEQGQQEPLWNITRLLEHWKEIKGIEILAAGPSMGAALFAAAKLSEAAGIFAKAVDMEEFCHVEYFEKFPADIPVIVLGGPGLYCHSREEEVKKILESLGRFTFYIEEPEVDEMWLPLLFCIDTARAAVQFCAFSECQNGETEPYFRGFKGVWENGRCPGVKDSRLIL